MDSQKEASKKIISFGAFFSFFKKNIHINNRENPVNDENFGWYMKEYGCDSIEEASKLRRKLELYFNKLGIK